MKAFGVIWYSNLEISTIFCYTNYRKAVTKMTRLIIIFYVMLILLDIGLFTTFRDLMFSFLLSKRNKKGAKKIHLSQDRLNRFTFNYVKEHAIYKKEFNFFHKFYIANLYFTPVQYLLVIILNFISIKITFIFQIIFCTTKLICNFILWSQQNSSRVFKFDKRYK